jgi:cytidylate kinase
VTRAGDANPAPVIAVDGPSGSGKGTLCRGLSRVLGFHLLDSGALYRLTALAALRAGVSLDDDAALAETARTLDARFQVTDGDPPVRALLAGQPVDEALRGEDCGEAASRVAAVPGVRHALLARQRAFRRPPGLVADGRDMGTVVFPDALCKLFLTATPRERAARRHKQLIAKGISATFPALLRDIQERDRRDSERRVAPLKPATDAVRLDTSDLTADEVLARVKSLLRACGVACPGEAQT